MTHFIREFTNEQFTYYEQEMRKYELPWITKIFKKILIPFFRFGLLPVLLVMIVLGIIYNSTPVPIDWLWTALKVTALTIIFGCGGISLIGHLAELITVNRLRRRLGLSKTNFQILIVKFQITGM